MALPWDLCWAQTTSSLVPPRQRRSIKGLGLPGFAAFSSQAAKRVIYLFMSGGPSHLDLFDYKPELKKRQGDDLPDSVRQGQRLTGMTANQKNFPVVRLHSGNSPSTARAAPG